MIINSILLVTLMTTETGHNWLLCSCT